ncbi:capsular exopolysaccharide synthesis family protein [Azospirillum agricola]|uniref:hypothetical protein n=1 Tax=Azospirillum agricola TaxID=1720247 RepID=UPI001AE60EFE|nr:hypothetical protein [Azospirillum agricola]MBP2227752.1 capsular exopolysaccharide synthesis family protein [Azospirillum agricola]
MAISQDERRRPLSARRNSFDHELVIEQNPARTGASWNAGPGDAGLGWVALAFRRYLLLIVAVTAALSGLFALAADLVPSRYTATALVMIEPRKGQVFQFANVVSSLPPDLAVVKSETDVLQSHALARKVAERLDPARRRGALGDGMGDGIGLRLRNETARLRAALSPWLPAGLLPDVPAPAAAAPEGFPDADVFLDRVAKTLQERIQILVDGRSYVFHIRYRSTDPTLAAAVANAYAAAYIKDQLDLKRALIRGANGRIEGGLEALERQARESDMAVQRYVADHGLFQVGGETLAAQQLGGVGKELSQIAADRADKEAALAELRRAAQDANGAASRSAVLKSPLIERLREREAEMTQRLANLRERYMGNHPEVVAATAALRDLRGKIADEIERIIRNAQGEVDTAARREAAARERLKALQSNAGVAEEDMVALRELQRRAAADRSLYESFLHRAGETLAEQSTETPDARIVSEAPVPEDAFPPRALLVAGGVVVSAVLAGLLALLLERRRAGIRTETDAEALLGVPVLGMTLDTRRGGGGRNGGRNSRPVDLVARDRSSAYSESLAQIRTGVQQSVDGLAPKVVLVTSSIPGEGKSVFAASFARGAALSRIRTLVVECDMRRPTLARLLSARPPRPVAGLRSLEAGFAGLERLVHTDPDTGLDFIPAGDGDAHPEDILRSLDFERLILEARRCYDLIVLDAPPVLSVSDARIIAPLADHMILALRWDSTRPNVAQAALKSLRSSGLQGIGVVLTQVDMRRQALYQPQVQSYGYASHPGVGAS